MFLRNLALAALISLAFVTVPAHAGFLGHTIDADYRNPTIGTIHTNFAPLVVGAGLEYGPFGLFGVDLTDNQIVVSNLLGSQVYFLPAHFNGMSFFDVFATIDPILNVTINPATNVAGFDSSRVFFNQDTLWFNMQGLNHEAGQVVVLDVEFPASEAPEPSTWLMLAAGLGTLAIRTLRL